MGGPPYLNMGQGEGQGTAEVSQAWDLPFHCLHKALHLSEFQVPQRCRFYPSVLLLNQKAA